jgi:hypothetical protein
MNRRERPDIRAQLRTIESGLTALGMVVATRPTETLKAPLVRRRGRSMGPADRQGLVRLIRQDDGLLVWHAGPAGRGVVTGRRRRRAAGPPLPPGEVVEMYRYDMLTRNQINDLVIGADNLLTGARLGLMKLAPGKSTFEPARMVAAGARRLLIVHGTFSNTEKMLSGADANLMNWARQKYGGEIYAFNHRTLSVSPMMNAFDLWQTFKDVEGDLDIVAHSRGGLVTRWFLEVMGPPKLKSVRVVLVGSPLGGTSLAAPRHLRNALSGVSSFASAVSHVSEALSTVATPWLAVPAMVIQVASSVVGKTADIFSNLPIFDAVISMIPGLSGQARIDGNAELSRLNAGPGRTNPAYFGVASNFEPTDPGWAFWKRLRLTNLADAAADGIFPKENDMVVDTGSMSELGGGRTLRDLQDYGTNPDVHHLNYFAQPKTTQRIQGWLV